MRHALVLWYWCVWSLVGGGVYLELDSCWDTGEAVKSYAIIMKVPTREDATTPSA